LKYQISGDVPVLGLAYFSTGNQTPDFWNGNRYAYSDEYNDSVVAVELKTGIERWHFRTANSDQFDYDVSSQPILYDLPIKDGKTTPVLIQLTKRGEVFVLDRRTGEPVIPVENRKVPTDAMSGMKVANTQPFLAISVGATPLKESKKGVLQFLISFTGVYSSNRCVGKGCLLPCQIKKRTLIYPGYYGGFNWGRRS